MSPAQEAEQERLRRLQARRVHALERVLRRMNGPESSGHQTRVGTASATGHLRPDHAAAAIRLLLQEMEKDPELADALRADLATSLQRAARDRMQRTLSSCVLVDTPQRQLFGTDEYDETSQVSHARQLRQVAVSLQSRHTGHVSMLREVENLLHALQLSQLKAAAVLSVTSPVGPAGSSAVVRNSVDVADSLEKLREATNELSRSAEMWRAATHQATRELSRSTEKLREAMRELSRSSERLRAQVQQMIDDRLAGDRDKPESGLFFSLGDMIDLGPRLQNSTFDPSLQNAFRSAGSLLTCALLSALASDETSHSAFFDAATMDQK